MVTAIVLINTQHGRINEVAEAIADMVTNRMVRSKASKNTETMIAFNTCSQHDLERIFSIGMK